jgi:hypothetical protein
LPDPGSGENTARNRIVIDPSSQCQAALLALSCIVA